MDLVVRVLRSSPAVGSGRVRGHDIHYMDCPGATEDLEHVFRGCKNVQTFWKRFISRDQISIAHELSFNEWLSWNLGLKSGADPLIP